MASSGLVSTITNASGACAFRLSATEPWKYTLGMLLAPQPIVPEVMSVLRSKMFHVSLKMSNPNSSTNRLRSPLSLPKISWASKSPQMGVPSW